MTRYVSIALALMMTMMMACGSSEEPLVVQTMSQERADQIEQAEHSAGFYNKEEVEEESREVIEERSETCIEDTTVIIDSTDGITDDEKGIAYSERAQCLFDLDNFSKEALQDWVSAAELLEDNIDKAEGYANAAKQMHMLFLKAMKTDWAAQADRNRYAELACEHDEEQCEFYWTDNILDRYRW